MVGWPGRGTTDAGRAVPYVVRVETGVMDRGAYAIATLVDGWTGKLLWPFGGDCRPWHAQDSPVDPLGGLAVHGAHVDGQPRRQPHRTEAGAPVHERYV